MAMSTRCIECRWLEQHAHGIQSLEVASLSGREDSEDQLCKQDPKVLEDIMLEVLSALEGPSTNIIIALNCTMKAPTFHAWDDVALTLKSCTGLLGIMICHFEPCCCLAMLLLQLSIPS